MYVGFKKNVAQLRQTLSSSHSSCDRGMVLKGASYLGLLLQGNSLVRECGKLRIIWP